MNKFEATKEIFTTPLEIKDNLKITWLENKANQTRSQMLDDSNNKYYKDFLTMKINEIDESIQDIVNNDLLETKKYLDRFDSMLKRGLFWRLKEWSEEYKYIEVYFNIKREELEKIVQLKKEIIS